MEMECGTDSSSADVIQIFLHVKMTKMSKCMNYGGIDNAKYLPLFIKTTHKFGKQMVTI